MVGRAIAALAIVAMTLSPALAGIDETYERPAEMPSWSDLYKRVLGSSDFGKSYALVIGIGDYDVFPKLGAPAKDAKRVTDFLRDEAGFDYIVTLTDEKATRSRIETLLETLLPNLVGKRDRFILYFSGHGATRTLADDEKRGYLVLKESRIGAWNQMFDMPRVLQYAENLQHARHTLFILDACFSGLAAVQIKGSREKTIERLSQPVHQLVTAGVENEQSYATDKESLFTEAFLRAARGNSRAAARSDVVSLSEIMIEINQSLDEVRAKDPNIRMSPHQYLFRTKNNSGDFFFIQKDSVKDGTAKAPIPRPDEGPIPKGPGRIPNRVSIGPDTVFFHPSNGKPLLWFGRAQDYEFFDGPGFHPRTGEQLREFTRDEAKKFEAYVADKQRDNQRERDRLALEKEAREERDAAAKEALARKQEEDRKVREAESARASEAGQKCDELAANPNDRNKVGQGASFGALKAQAAEAVKACELAAKQKPAELRFKYQLARALQFSDRPRSFAIHKELVGQHYGASYDNLGWMYYTDRKDRAQAIALFRQGIQVGDVDSMVSLAELVDRAEVTPANGLESKIELCRRAAELGHLGARQCYQAEIAKQEQAEKDRVVQLEQQKMMIQLMGAVIQGATRR